jgi:preprotein translocase subunit YajC
VESVVLAQETSASGWTSIIFLAVMVGVFYLLIIRPQRKRAQKQKEMAATLEVGAEIRTIGGIHGTVVSIDDDSVVLKVEDGRIRVTKRAIGTRVGEDA